jgi:Mrp family chromosome partitioning ATPase
MVDGVGFVVHGQQTKKHLVKSAVSQLKNGQAKVLGVVLNRVDIRSAEYADYYRPSYAPYYSHPNGTNASQRNKSDLQQWS